MTNEIVVSLPSHLQEEWDEEVKEANVSRSEWIRNHVEAGRKQLAHLNPKEGKTKDRGLQQDILNKVDEDEAVPSDEIVDRVLDPLENEVYDTLETLNEAGEIGFDPREGGYRRK